MNDPGLTSLDQTSQCWCARNLKGHLAERASRLIAQFFVAMHPHHTRLHSFDQHDRGAIIRHEGDDLIEDVIEHLFDIQQCAQCCRCLPQHLGSALFFTRRLEETRTLDRHAELIGDGSKHAFVAQQPQTNCQQA